MSCIASTIVRRMGVLLPVLVFLAVSGQAQQAPSAAAAPADKIAKGKKNFVTYLCFGCHGYTGQGGTDTGPRIDTNRLSYDAFSKYVRKPGGSMPPYASQKQLPDAALDEIYAYLKSLPPSPDPKNIPLLTED